jgi:hypothetical protein
MDSHYVKALEQALAWIRSTYHTTGILVSGSIARGNPDENSDFDIYVIHGGSFRQRVQKLFNGIPCEIFVNNLEQVYRYFESEQKNNRPVTANMIATGTLVSGSDDPGILALIDDAKKFAVKAGILSEEQLIFQKYGLANLLEDATDVLDTDRVTLSYILDRIIIDAIAFAFAKKQYPLPRLKERMKALAIAEPLLSTLVEKYYEEADVKRKYSITREIVLALTGYTGFFEWSSEPE